MSRDTVKLTKDEELPFFARFLVEQASKEEDTPPSTPDDFPTPPPIYTFKFPSDWEDI